MTPVEFTVYGRPQPQGSARAFWKQGMKRAVITCDNSTLRPWRQDVAQTAIASRGEQAVEEGPVEIGMRFYFEKPKSAKKGVVHKITKPDIDKLARGILDALTGTIIKDDSQVVLLRAVKSFGLPERVEVVVGSAAPACV